jgi:hypothetical protein
VGGIDHQEQLHEVFTGLHSGAYQKNPAAADGFFEGRLEFTIAKFLDDNFPEGLSVHLSYLFGNASGAADGKYFSLGRQT